VGRTLKNPNKLVSEDHYEEVGVKFGRSLSQRFERSKSSFGDFKRRLSQATEELTWENVWINMPSNNVQPYEVVLEEGDNDTQEFAHDHECGDHEFGEEELAHEADFDGENFDDEDDCATTNDDEDDKEPSAEEILFHQLYSDDEGS
jgi:hypothetical protein